MECSETIENTKCNCKEYGRFFRCDHHDDDGCDPSRLFGAATTAKEDGGIEKKKYMG
jgi:hypothetical protein